MESFSHTHTKKKSLKETRGKFRIKSGFFPYTSFKTKQNKPQQLKRKQKRKKERGKFDLTQLYLPAKSKGCFK